MTRTTTIRSTNCCNSRASNGITCAQNRIEEIDWTNKQLSGRLPTDFGNLTSLKKLSLRRNKLWGSVPTDLARLKNLLTLDLSYNQLTGDVPSIIGNLTALTTLNLSNNKLTGVIPESIGNLSKLTTLQLSQNNFTGSIPKNITNLVALEALHLEHNSLNGTLTESFRKLKSLRTLSLHSNKLTGNFPNSIGYLKNLTTLWINRNHFDGQIPASLGNLANLKSLWLFSNKFTGLPTSLLASTAQKIMFPNPMPNVPYDLVRPVSIGTLKAITWDSFMNATVSSLKKRHIATSAPVSTDELIAMCPLNNIEQSNVAAGCIAGIYNKFCRSPNNIQHLKKCHEMYEKVFAASIFKPLGDVCPAWRKGPFSSPCQSAIRAFSYLVIVGTNPETGASIYLKLGPPQAAELVKNIFASPIYAPCPTSSSHSLQCNWK